MKKRSAVQALRFRKHRVHLAYRADVGIGPYKRPRRIQNYRGRTESSAPTNAREKPCESGEKLPHFLLCTVGVDAHLRR